MCERGRVMALVLRTSDWSSVGNVLVRVSGKSYFGCLGLSSFVMEDCISLKL